MVVFFSGLGWLAPVFGVLGLVLAIAMSNSPMPGVDEHVPFIAGASLAALACWFAGRELNKSISKHTLMSIPLQWYAVPYIAIVVLLIVTAKGVQNTQAAEANAIVDRTDLWLHRDATPAQATRIIMLPRGTKVRIVQSNDNGWAKISVVAMGDTEKAPNQPLDGFVNAKFLTSTNTQITTSAPAVQAQPSVTVASDQSSYQQQTSANVITYRCDNLMFDPKNAVFQFTENHIKFRLLSIDVSNLYVGVEEYDADGPSRTVGFRNKYRYQGKNWDGTDTTFEQFVEASDRTVVYGERSISGEYKSVQRAILDRATGILKVRDHPYQCNLLAGR